MAQLVAARKRGGDRKPKTPHFKLPAPWVPFLKRVLREELTVQEAVTELGLSLKEATKFKARICCTGYEGYLGRGTPGSAYPGEYYGIRKFVPNSRQVDWSRPWVEAKDIKEVLIKNVESFL